jgi:hypothetical protein
VLAWLRRKEDWWGGHSLRKSYNWGLARLLHSPTLFKFLQFWFVFTSLPSVLNPGTRGAGFSHMGVPTESSHTGIHQNGQMNLVLVPGQSSPVFLTFIASLPHSVP